MVWEPQVQALEKDAVLVFIQWNMQLWVLEKFI